MSEQKRQVEVFTAGCPLCDEAVELVRSIECPSCEVVVHDLTEGGEAVERARGYGVNAVPAVVVDGRLAECCSRGPVDEQTLRAVGVGVA